MEKSKIKHFKIFGLFGERTVSISFSKNVMILVGENGLGKTTVLSMLYYTMTNKLFKLKDFEFDKISIAFSDGENVEISKKSLTSSDENLDFDAPPELLNRLARNLGPEDVKILGQAIADNSPGYALEYLESRSLLRGIMMHTSRRSIYAALRVICGNPDTTKEVKRAKDILNAQFAGFEVLYFPTFRRIEEDLINLGFDEERFKINQSDTRLIQFGMADVRARFEDLKKEIDNLSSRGLAQISSEILSQLVKGVPNIDSGAFKRINKNDIDIILARVGDAISKEDKNQITKIISARRQDELDDKYLIYFLQKLIAIYEKQKEIDIAIEGFVTVCNKYLKISGKSIHYEASEVEFYIVSHLGKRVKMTQFLGKLSSGEKQIISLFSRIYLSKIDKFIVLFDEPELSLSIFWQKMLLPDIVASKKCALLLSVTHSPFIFENDLAEFATPMSSKIK